MIHGDNSMKLQCSIYYHELHSNQIVHINVTSRLVNQQRKNLELLSEHSLVDGLNCLNLLVLHAN